MNSKLSSRKKSIWGPSAEDLDGELSVLFKTNIIEDFFNTNKPPSYFGLAATKGIGKSYLIQSKRRVIENLKDNNITRYAYCLPAGNPARSNNWGTEKIEIGISDISRFMLAKLKNSFDPWIKLWKYSVLLSIVKRLSKDHDLGLSTDDRLSNSTKALLKNQNYTTVAHIYYSACQIGNQKEYDDINKDINILKVSLSILERIDKKVALFIDTLDQIFLFEKEENANIKSIFWRRFQQSLIVAVNQIINDSILINYTIRQEALDDLSELGQQTAKFTKDVLWIKYSKQDQREMFKAYISNENTEHLFDNKTKTNKHNRAFVGVDTVTHATVKKENGAFEEEDVFDCIYRHSFDRARDIQEHGKALSKIIETLKNTQLEKDKKTIVRKTIKETAKEITKNGHFRGSATTYNFLSTSYLDEQKFGLPKFWQDKDTLPKLLKLFTTNVFDEKYAHKICCAFNDIADCNKDCDVCDKHHPLSVLYNMGLLGYFSAKDFDDDKYIQNFKNASMMTLIKDEHKMPPNPNKLFMLHPSLIEYINDIKTTRPRVEHTELFIVGKDNELSKCDYNVIYNKYKSKHAENNIKKLEVEIKIQTTYNVLPVNPPDNHINQSNGTIESDDTNRDCSKNEARFASSKEALKCATAQIAIEKEKSLLYVKSSNSFNNIIIKLKK
ncbi:MAG: hypothetical protein FWD86_01795, partial [Firmicutes bacterium]|nr:hypothetical protein [Bacillota bacterium]